MNHVGPIEDDVRTETGREMYLVRPSGGSAGPGIIYLHWFDESPTANRTQFLDEAREMADRGVVSILPQLTFPWQSAPESAESDLRRVEDELSFLKEVHSKLGSQEGVDPTRIAIVGHDFGAMYGVLLAAEVNISCSVLVAPTPRWPDWFLRFWPIRTDRYEYMRALRPVDPIEVISRLGGPVLFQFAGNDFYIAGMTAAELHHAASEPKTMTTHDGGHSMTSSSARAERNDFLIKVLSIGD